MHNLGRAYPERTDTGFGGAKPWSRSYSPTTASIVT
jgi:hypothetical protein